jgi:lysophospholipase L1-like esterase
MSKKHVLLIIVVLSFVGLVVLWDLPRATESKDMTFASDNFTNTNGTLLQAHTSTSGHTWTKTSAANNAVIQSNRLGGDGGAAATSVYRLGATPATADYTVEAVLTVATGGGHGVIGRCNSAGTNFYLARYFQSLGQWQLFSFVSGSGTNIGTFSEVVSVGASRTVTLSMVGTAIKVLVDGVERISVTSSTVTAAGFAGVRMDHLTAGTLDNFVAQNVGVVPDTISVTDSNLVAGCTPYNWIVSGSSLWTVHTPAGLQFSFSGTDLVMNIDVSAMSGYTSTAYPVIVYSIDNGAFTQVQLTSAMTSITLATGLSAGTHTVDVWQTKTASTGNNWTPTNGLRITSFSVSPGGTTVSRTLSSRRILIYGDSITRGRGMDDTVLPGGNGLHAWSMGLAASVGSRPGIVGISGQGWTNIGAGSEPDFEDAWDFVKTGTSRLSSGLLSPMPDMIAICHGTNDSLASDAAVTAAVTSTLNQIRAAAPDVPIFVIVPFGQIKVSAITAGVTASAGTLTPESLWESTVYTGATDTKMYMIDLGANASLGITGPTGTATQQSTDKLHPNEVTVNQIAARVAACIGYLTAEPGTGGFVPTDEWDNLRAIARNNGLELITQ